MTDKTVGSTFNRTDSAAVTAGIVLNSTTSTTIAAAFSERIVFRVSGGNSNQHIWVKLQAASVDNDKKGIFIHRISTGAIDGFWEMLVDNVYVGEISAIADSGNPTIYVTEY